jgi:hypothetical protein
MGIMDEIFVRLLTGNENENAGSKIGTLYLNSFLMLRFKSYENLSVSGLLLTCF